MITEQEAKRLAHKGLVSVNGAYTKTYKRLFKIAEFVESSGIRPGALELRWQALHGTLNGIVRVYRQREAIPATAFEDYDPKLLEFFLGVPEGEREAFAKLSRAQKWSSRITRGHVGRIRNGQVTLSQLQKESEVPEHALKCTPVEIPVTTQEACSPCNETETMDTPVMHLCTMTLTVVGKAEDLIIVLADMLSDRRVEHVTMSSMHDDKYNQYGKFIVVIASDPANVLRSIKSYIEQYIVCVDLKYDGPVSEVSKPMAAVSYEVRDKAIPQALTEWGSKSPKVLNFQDKASLCAKCILGGYESVSQLALTNAGELFSDGFSKEEITCIDKALRSAGLYLGYTGVL